MAKKKPGKPNRAKPVDHAKPQPQKKNKVVKGGYADVGKVIKSLSAASIDGLGGLYETTRAKMKQLGLKGSVALPEVEKRKPGEAEPTVNIRGVLNWVNSINKESSDEDKAGLHAVHTLLVQRRKASGIA